MGRPSGYYVLTGNVDSSSSDTAGGCGCLILLAAIFGYFIWTTCEDEKPAVVSQPAAVTAQPCRCRPNEPLPPLAVPTQLEQESSPAMREFLHALVERVNANP